MQQAEYYNPSEQITEINEPMLCREQKGCIVNSNVIQWVINDN
jgi:hypothetical protein